jgi:diadenosine tetraphosphate (Ap4A) HIT family hydrolase
VSSAEAHADVAPGAGSCHTCDLRTKATQETLIHVDDLWTAIQVLDVPGWIMVMANRHSGDWLWGLSGQEASTLGPLMQRLSEAARVEADAERVYFMGFGEQVQHFHFMLLSRSRSTAPEMRGAGMLEHASKLANQGQALRVAAKIRNRLAANG